MESLSIIEHTAFLTSVHSPFEDSILYTVASRRHPDGFWVDVVNRIERGDRTHSGSENHERHSELATVFYIDAGTTRVRFAGELETNTQGEQRVEGGVELGLDAFLRRRKAYSNSRMFVGPDGVTYKWRIDGKRLELLNTNTNTLIARSYPRRSKFRSLISLPWITKRTEPPISKMSPARTPLLHHPTLSIHPALLSLDSDSDAPQLLDAIVLTFFIMQRLLRERLRYRYLGRA